MYSTEDFCDKTYRNQGSNEYAQYQRMTSSGSAYLGPSFAKPAAGMNPPTSAPTTSLPDIPKDKTYVINEFKIYVRGHYGLLRTWFTEI